MAGRRATGGRAAVSGASLILARHDLHAELPGLHYEAHAVVVDFTGRNSNVMYETGIAHTLGKHVIPITQSREDVPFDIQHHRALLYLPNAQGFAELEAGLTKKLAQFALRKPPIPFHDRLKRRMEAAIRE
jgi:hypothetical protein